MFGFLTFFIGLYNYNTYKVHVLYGNYNYNVLQVSVGSVTAPRQTIDVTPPTVNEGKKEVVSRKKQALVTIEKVHYTAIVSIIP